MTKLQWIKLSVLILIPAMGALYAYQFTGQAREEIVPFKPFMPKSLQVSRGQVGAASLESFDLPLKAPVTLVNFWATWCPPCVEEFPAMLELQRRLEGKVDVVFVSIDEKWEDVDAFFKKHGLEVAEGRLFWDPKRDLATSWGSQKFPESYVVRRDAWAVERIVGLQQWTRPAVVEYFEDLAERFATIKGGQPLSATKGQTPETTSAEN
jgi:cytochrome c biogenesis protein CcmG, thiol:disulfide interchange protein DsbE